MTPDPYTVVFNRIKNHLHDAFDEIVSTLGDDLNVNHVDEFVWDQWDGTVGYEWARYARTNINKEEA